MEYRRLGKSGLRVSELSYGSWVTFSFQLDKAKAKKTMKHAYEAGAKTGAQRLIGSVGEVQQTPGPLGYIRVNGELWRTKVNSDGRLLPPGTRVLVQAAHGLTLHVIPLDQPAQRVNDHC